MEVNGRFWGSLQLGTDAGINFPLILYRLALGECVPCDLNYQIGVKSRWLLGDLDQLLIRLSHSGESNGFAKVDISQAASIPGLHEDFWAGFALRDLSVRGSRARLVRMHVLPSRSVATIWLADGECRCTLKALCMFTRSCLATAR